MRDVVKMAIFVDFYNIQLHISNQLSIRRNLICMTDGSADFLYGGCSLSNQPAGVFHHRHEICPVYNIHQLLLVLAVGDGASDLIVKGEYFKYACSALIA